MSKRILFPALVIAALWGAYELNKGDAPFDSHGKYADGGDVPIQRHSLPEVFAADGLTNSQKNAVREAHSYLAIQGYSRLGLIRQLSSDYGAGFSKEDATVAVDSLNVNWNENAVRSANSYLNIQGYSCKGLIRQLSSEYGSGYTVAQAQYGAKQSGACN